MYVRLPFIVKLYWKRFTDKLTEYFFFNKSTIDIKEIKNGMILYNLYFL